MKFDLDILSMPPLLVHMMALVPRFTENPPWEIWIYILYRVIHSVGVKCGDSLHNAQVLCVVIQVVPVHDISTIYCI